MKSTLITHRTSRLIGVRRSQRPSSANMILASLWA